ncbi:MAG: TetR/AcrR family transcriptional regulator [Leptospiraceae bacterium]|nr:TetR/AcrR family transcriptional regulator [Leptospiraceae bacterium]
MNIHSAMGVRDPDITRKVILDAALRMFAERGFHGTNVPDLARTAAVGAGSIYRHFEDKEGLVNAVYAHWKERFRQAILEPAPDMRLGFQDQFLELWARLWRFYRKNPEAMVFLDVHAHGDYLSKASRAISDTFEEELARWIGAGQQEKALADGKPRELISLTYGAFIGLVKREQTHGRLGPGVPEESGHLVWKMLSPG